jgi:CubicO group peptidase (beta-lactamase class C family)
MSLFNLVKKNIDLEITTHLFPGCSLGVVTNEKIEFLSAGQQTYETSSFGVNEDTIYDVASITKSIPTSSLVLQLIKVGKIKLEDKLDKYVPETRNQPVGEITIHQLLTLSPQFPFTMSLLKDKTAEEILETIFHSRWSLPQDQNFPISNATAILLTLVLQNATGKTLAVLAEDTFFSHLKMQRTSFYPDKFSVAEIAPTEIQDWRGGLVRGQVHDESAWKLRQKLIVGSAGLFSCVNDLTKFIIWQLKNNSFQPLGWEKSRSWMGTTVSAQAFGKTGFTGCFILMDPLQNRGLVFLSNCVYPHRPLNRQPFNQFRQNLCTLIFDRNYEIT